MEAAAPELCFDSQEALLASSAVQRLIESGWLALADLEPWSATAARESTAEAVSPLHWTSSASPR